MYLQHGTFVFPIIFLQAAIQHNSKTLKKLLKAFQHADGFTQEKQSHTTFIRQAPNVYLWAHLKMIEKLVCIGNGVFYFYFMRFLNLSDSLISPTSNKNEWYGNVLHGEILMWVELSYVTATLHRDLKSLGSFRRKAHSDLKALLNYHR